MKVDYNWVPYLSHEKYIEDNKSHYYESLRATQASFLTKKIDYDPWIGFFCLILSRQSKYLESQVLNNAEIRSLVHKLGKNEKLVISTLGQFRSLSRSELVNKVIMSEAGMKRLLRRLRDRDLIAIIGSGKNTKYSLPPG